MNDLIVKITGEIVESNFNAYHADLIRAIKGASKVLVTDEDFLTAADVVKTCKTAEKAITEAKQAAISQTLDIDKLFAKMDEVSKAVRTTRVVLEKQIRTEQVRRKTEIIDAGVDLVQKKVDLTKKTIPQIVNFYRINRPLFDASIKGKRTIETIQDAIDEKVKFEFGQIDRFSLLIVDNLDQIKKTEVEYHGLFPDKDQICGEHAETVKNLCEARIANFKLRTLEKKVEESAAAKKAKESAAAKKAEESAAAKKAEESAAAKKVEESAAAKKAEESAAAEKVEESAAAKKAEESAAAKKAKESAAAEKVEESAAAEKVEETTKTETSSYTQHDIPQLEKYILTFKIEGTRNSAITFAKKMIEFAGQETIFVDALLSADKS